MKIPGIFKPSKKKIIIFIILGLAIFLGFRFFGPKKAAPLQFATVKRQDIKSTVSSSGNLTGENTANLRFKSSGKLSYIKVKAGDKVTEGQLIAGLDTQDLAITLQQARNTFVAKDAAAKRIEDDVKNHDKDETFTQKEDRTAAQTARDNAFDSVKAAERAFQDAVIVSPISGIVTQSIEVSGQIVTAADIIAQIVDNSAIYFDADIDEADFGAIALGMKAEITLDAYPGKTFTGVVEQIIPQTKTTSQGATVVTVRIKLDDQSLALVNGLSGQVSVITNQVDNVLSIPQEALRDDNTVAVGNNSKYINKQVIPGIRSDTDVEIKNGLTEGESVLLNPPAK